MLHAAVHQDFKARIGIENLRHAQTVRDNAQMVMVEQRTGDLLSYFSDGSSISFGLFSCLAIFGSAFVNSLNWG